MRVINNVGISLKKIVSEMAPATNKINATNNNFPFVRTSAFSDFIDVRENRRPVIIERTNTENTYNWIGNLYSISITPCSTANTEGSLNT